MISDRIYSRFTRGISARALRRIGKLNVPIYRLSRGRLMGNVGKAPVLLLTTTGRKSGQQRTAPVLYRADGDRLIVIGSNAGNANTPAWSLNLQAKPDALVDVRGDKREVRARIAEGEERKRLWRAMNDQFGGFDDYKVATDRDIKVFVLDRR